MYYEEKVLGQKFRKMGLKTVLVTDESYVHAHSVSIDKSFKRIVDKQRLLHRSKLYYYKEYLGTGPAGMAAARGCIGTRPGRGVVSDRGVQDAVVGRRGASGIETCGGA